MISGKIINSIFPMRSAKHSYTSLSDKQFGSLFKKFRLRSEIETVSEFANVMAEEGVLYETSLIHRWQKGQRIPRKRTTVTKLVEVFAKRGGIHSEDEVRAFLRAANHRDMDDKERHDMLQFLSEKNARTTPKPVHHFIGREQIRKDMSWDLLRQQTIMLTGFPGMGKTALVRQLMGEVSFPSQEAIFWFDAQLTSGENMMNYMLGSYGVHTRWYRNYDEKLCRIRNLLAENRAVVVLDGMEARYMDGPFIRDLFSLSVSVIVIARFPLDIPRADHVSLYALQPLSKEEYRTLARKILGDSFVYCHLADLEQIGEAGGYVPAWCRSILRRIARRTVRIKDVIADIRTGTVDLSQIRYSGTHMHAALTWLYSWLTQEEKDMVRRFQQMGSEVHRDELSRVSSKLSVTLPVVEGLREKGVLRKVGDESYAVVPLVRMYG
jgi:hypothetical protein